MYQYASKGKAQSEGLKSGASTANKNHAQTGIKAPVQLMPQRPSSPLQMQLRSQQENSEAQPIPMILSEEQTRLSPISDKPNNTGIPLQMKEKFENLSGFSFDDVNVHYNSDKPAQLQALAYTQGNQVYIGSGQEEHLGHELGHVVQQKQGRVRADSIYNNAFINNNASLEKEADSMAQGLHSSNYLDAPVDKALDDEKVIQRWSVPVHSSIIEYAFKSMTPAQINVLEQVLRGVPQAAAAAANGTGIDSRRSTAEVSDELERINANDDLNDQQTDMLRNIKKGSAWNDLTEEASSWEGSGFKVRIGLWLKGKLNKEPVETNLEHRKIVASHEGAMQFLHAQADADETPVQTRGKMIGWAHTCYEICLAGNNALIPPVPGGGGVALPPMTLGQALANAGIPLPGAAADPRDLGGSLQPFLNQPLSKFFNSKAASDAGNDIDKRCAKIRQRALGSLVHMVQDSFNQAHGQRTAGKRLVNTPHGDIYVGKMKNFTVYNQQDGTKHKKYDLPSDVGEYNNPTFNLMTDYTGDTAKLAETEGFLDAMRVTRIVMDFIRNATPWGGGPDAFFASLFELDNDVANPANIANWQAGPVLVGPTTVEITNLRASSLDTANQALELYQAFGGLVVQSPRVLPNSGKTLRAISIGQLADSADFNIASKTTSQAYDRIINAECARVNKIQGSRVEIIENKLVFLMTQQSYLANIRLALLPVNPNPLQRTHAQNRFLNELHKESLDALIDIRSLHDELNQM